jgi:hypothetical protein
VLCAVSSLDIFWCVGLSQVLPLVRARVGPEEGFLVVVGGGTEAIEALQGQEGVEVNNHGLEACVAGDGQLMWCLSLGFCLCLTRCLFDSACLCVSASDSLSLSLPLPLCISLAVCLWLCLCLYVRVMSVSVSVCLRLRPCWFMHLCSCAM